MIRLTNISKSFQRPDEVIVFRDLNMEFREGEFTLVIGSNGSGKSTLLNLLAGTEKPEKGSVLLNQKDITKYKDFQRSKWIARIHQNPLSGTAPDLTILENFRLASLRTKSKGFAIGTDDAFRMFVKEKVSILNLGLENKLDQKMGNLSGGQRQSLSLLMAIADDTQLLLLDEPTAALDPKTSELIMQLAQKVITENKLNAVLVTHQLKQVLQYGDRIIQLKEGRIERDILKNEKERLTLTEVFEWFE